MILKKENFEFIDGMLVSRNKASVSYPEGDSNLCFEIEEKSFWFQSRNRYILETIRKFCKGPVFFDVGGGNGFQAKMVQDSGKDVTLIEPGFEGAKNAKKRGVKNVICGVLGSRDFETNSIPNIGLFDVVEHIDDDLSFLKMIHSHTENGGKIFITVPAYQLLWSETDVRAGHFRRYSRAEIEKVCRQAGFRIVYSSYIFSYLFFPLLALRVLKPFFAGKKGSDETGKEATSAHHAGRISGLIIGFFSSVETFFIRNSLPIPFGGSVILVAEKC